ncbi:unnamed protein product [Symbiodinium sp. CCMP2456]|nr:unnamed protein product [Symbiodinium sp. CCMP2456]
MALGKILMGCGLLLMLSSQQSFVPAAFGKQEAPRPELSTARPMDMAQGVETSAPSSASSILPLAGGLALGLALVLPQRAMAATGNDDIGTLVDRLFTKEALGAFGIAGLSWNVQDLCRKAVEAAAAGEVCQVSGYLHKRGFLVGGTKLAMEGFQKLAKSARAMQVTLCKSSPFLASMLSRLSRDGGASRLVRSEQRAAAPPALDVTSIEDDARLNAIAGMSGSFSEGRLTPHIGSTSAEGSPEQVRSDDSALADLVGPRRTPRTPARLLVTDHVVRVGDDFKLSRLIGPQQADSDDAALALQACCLGAAQQA